MDHDNLKHCIEPIHELAQLAWDAAPNMCRPDHGCSDYHRSWGLVRLLVGNGRPPAGETFYQRELEKIFRRGGRRILVSGGADSGLLTIALKACRTAGFEPDIVFADRCATACEVNARMAMHAQAKVHVVEGDICELDIAPVDAVLAHSFLPFFEGEKRQAVLDAWYRNCKVDGEILISNVLKASESDWVTQRSTQALHERSIKFLQGARDAGYPLEVCQEMVQSAERFWQISPGQPPGLTEANLQAGLARAGFDQISFRYSAAGVNEGPMAMVRVQLEGKARAEVIAVKRQ
jgi:ubiquinone/menaquinone biosynthesis C-methylase UbiE